MKSDQAAPSTITQGPDLQYLRKQVTQIVSQVVVYLLVGVMGVLMAAPFVWMISTSFKTYEQVFVWPPEWIPRPWVWENYPNAMRAAPFARYYLNTFIMALGVVVGRLMVCMLAAYSLGRLNYPGRNLVFALLVSTMMLPDQVTLVPLFLITKKLGWLNSYQGLIVPNLVSAYNIFFLRQFFRTIPKDLDDAARIDGAGQVRTLLSIILPLSTPALTVVTLFSFTSAWGSFLWPLIVTTRSEMRTIEIGMAFFADAHGGIEYPMLMAANTVALLPVAAVFILAQKNFVKGIALTGIKG
ncbi:MAG: carbohydrate ABC transporter permease [Anaerolineales bacterium]|nr:carbohydrate ABC transporter permease [Anaerolineales bacterium]